MYHKDGVTFHATAAGTHTAAYFTTQPNTAYSVVATCVGQSDADKAKVMSTVLAATFANDGGTLTQQGSTTSVHAKTGFTGGPSSFAFSTSGTSITVRWVTQLAAKCRVRLTVLATGGLTAPHEWGQPDNA